MLTITYFILQASTIFNALVSLIVGVLVYIKNPTNKIHRTFAVFCFFMLLWSSMYFWPFVYESESLSLLSFQLEHIGAIFIAVAHLHFICAFLGVDHENKKKIYIGYIINFIFLLLLPTKLYITGVSSHEPLLYYVDVGYLYHIWLFIWIIYILYSLYLLLSHYKTTNKVQKEKIKYIFIGEVLTAFFGSTNYLLAYGISIVPYFNIFASGQVLMIFYIIVRYRFFDIRFNILRFMRRILIFFLSFSGSLFFYFTVHFYIPEEFSLISTLCLFYFLLTAIHRLVDRYVWESFLKYSLNDYHLQDYKEVVDTFIDSSKIYTDLSDIKKDIYQCFCNKLGLSSARIVLLSKTHTYPVLEKYFLTTSEALVLQEEESINPQGSKNKELQQLGEVCFPLYQGKEKLIGFFVLGNKLFNDLYTKEEIDVLKQAALYLSLNISNVLYSEELQREIEEKTKSLQLQNTKIKNLLSQQSDFIALTAHEFRTPLSIALFQLEDVLETYDHSHEVRADMQLISNALENLRILTQRLFDVQQYDLNKVELHKENIEVKIFMKKIYREFIPLFIEKNIIFTSDINIHDTCRYRFDLSQIQQIFTNIFGNANKFTPNYGKVHLHVSIEEKKLIIKIEDSGGGVPDNQKKQIFEKFQIQKATIGTGIGLGLYIVQKIVELHHGRIFVTDSIALGGACFVMEFDLEL